jgi:hypothetical protein
LLLGVVVALIEIPLIRFIDKTPGVDHGAAWMACVLIPYWIVLLWLCRITQRSPTVLWTAMLIALPLAPVHVAFNTLAAPTAGARPAFGAWGDVDVTALGPLFTVSVGVVALAAAARLFVRAFVLRLVEPDPATCAECGYLLGDDQRIAACPECGLARGAWPRQSGALWNSWYRLQGRARWVSPLLLAVIGAWAVDRVVRVASPIRAFDRALMQEAGGGAIIGVGTRTLTSADMYSFWVEPTQGNRPGIAYAYKPDPRAGMPSMRLALCIYKDPRMEMTFGNSPIFIDLNRSQAEEVIRRGGVPPRLREAMYRRADELNWLPNRPARLVNLDGYALFDWGWTNSAPLDAAPYFDASGSNGNPN